MRRAPARPVRVCFVRTCCTVVVQEHDLRAAPVQCNAKRTLSSHVTVHASHPTLHTCTSHSTLHLISNHVISSHLISALLTCHLSKFFSTVFISSLSHLLEARLNSSQLFCTPESSYRQREVSCKKDRWAQTVFAHRCLRHRCIYTEKPFQNTLYYKACTKHFPVLPCTTKLAQSTSRYYFVLQSLHKALPSTTLYYEACAKHFPVYTTLNYKACTKYCPVPLCTTKKAQSTPQYYFVLQSLHKAFPSTTLYCKACTKYSAGILCTIKLAQSRSQYYFVLQDLHKALSSTTFARLAQSTSSYYFVLQSLHKIHLCTTKLAQSTSQYYFVIPSFHKSKLLQKEVFTQRNFLVHTDNRHCSSKTGSRRQSEKNMKHFLKGILKGKIPAPNLTTIC